MVHDDGDVRGAVSRQRVEPPPGEQGPCQQERQQGEHRHPRQQQEPVVDLAPAAELELRLQQELHRAPPDRHRALPVQQVNDHRHGGGEEAEE